MTILEDTRVITGGVDTHADMHVAAALDPLGGLLGVREFPATAAGYADLLSWLSGFGDLALVGVEGTGSYGAGLARYLAAARVRVVEVDRADRQDRHRQGKSDPLDAVSAARAAQSGRAAGEPKGRDGAVEAIRALMVAKRSARAERTQAINQARALLVTGPDDLRARFAGLTAAALADAIAALRPRPGDAAQYAVRIALRELGRRVEFLDGQLERLDDLIIPLVTARAPGLLSLYGVGPDTAALLLVAAGDHPRAAAQRGRLGAPVRRRAGPRVIGEGPAAPPEPRREPRGQPRPVADRDHPDERPRRHPRLHRAAHQGRPVQEGDHPLPEAVRRPRGLSPPARRRLTPPAPGAAWPAIRLPQPVLAFDRSAGRPGPSPALC
jgi:transposase